MDLKLFALMCLTFCFVPCTVGKYIAHLRNDLKIMSTKFGPFSTKVHSFVFYETLGDCNADFLDSMGYTCKEYIDNEYCTPNGGYGENWKDSWGPIRDYAMNGNDAFDCPECGCGGSTICY